MMKLPDTYIKATQNHGVKLNGGYLKVRPVSQIIEQHGTLKKRCLVNFL